MPQDIYSRDSSTLGGTFTAKEGKLTVRGQTPLVAQTFSASYAKSTQEVFDLSSDATYVVEGRARGRAQLGRVLGPSKGIVAFHKQYGDVCNMAGNSIQYDLNPGCGNADSGASISLTLQNCLVQQTGINVQAENMLVAEQVGLLFLSLVDTGDAGA